MIDDRLLEMDNRQVEQRHQPNIELDDGESMTEVYGSGAGFYSSLVTAAFGAYPRLENNEWTERLRFLTPMGRLRQPFESPDPGLSQERAGCCCAHLRYKSFSGTETYRLRLTSFKEVVHCPHYVAVSYCWSACIAESGPWRYKNFEIVTPRGCRPNRAPYQVIKRAIEYAAFRRLPFIWIDQECINQDDDLEKEAIIGEMDRIYRRATKVVAVLTATIYDSEFVRAILNMDTRTTRYRPVRQHVWTELSYSLAADPWFHRAWTWQEEMRAAQLLDILVPVYKSFPCSVRKEPAVDGECAIIPQEELIRLSSRDDATNVLGADIPGYKQENMEMDHEKDLTRHRLSSFVALSSLRGREISINADRVDIIANISSYSIRIKHRDVQVHRNKIGTLVFVQALLNGDMSLFLAYRHFLDPKDEVSQLVLGLPSDRSLTSMLLSSAKIEYIDWVPWVPGNLFRSRIVPVAVEPRGLVVRGQLWTMVRTFTVGKQDDGDSIPHACLDPSIEGKSWKHGDCQCIDMTRQALRRMPQHFLMDARIYIYAPYGVNYVDSKQYVVWNERGLTAPAALFAAERVLMDGEDELEHMLVWTISSFAEVWKNELILHDHLPRKINIAGNGVHSHPTYPTPFVGALALGATSFLQSTTVGVQEFLLKF